MRSHAILLGLFIILFATTASAVWVPSAVELVHEGQQLNVNGLLVQVKSIDLNERMVELVIKNDGKTIATSYLFEGEVAEVKDLLRISIDSFSPALNYGNQATLRFESWASARIVTTNFPEHMNYNDRYPVYAVVENTGKTDIEFLVELTEPGNFERKGRVYETYDSRVITELLKVDRPTKIIKIPAGESTRVEWLIGPNRRQSSYTSSVTKVGDVQFNVYAGPALLDSHTIYSVKASTEQSGYIADVVVPLVMITDVPYDGHTIVQNTGFASGGINSRKFGFKVITPGFEMEPNGIYEEINPHTFDEWGFILRAYEPGDHLLTFEFTFNEHFTVTQRVLDTFSVPVKVIKGFSTRIADVSIPTDVRLGENFLVGAVIENLGKSRQLDLVIESPALTEQAKTQRIILPVNGLSPVSFKLEATTYGRIPITLTLYDKSGSKENINYNPFDRGRAIETKTVYVNIPNPSAPARSVKTVTQPQDTTPVVETKPILPAPEPVGAVVTDPVVADEPKKVDTTPDTLPTQPVKYERNWTYIGLLIGGIIVLLCIMIAVISFELKKKP